jgi:hypothetical protein
MSYPLGEPIRPKPKEGPDWVAIDPRKPHIQRNTKTGQMRNVAPPPPTAYVVGPWYGLPVINP